MKFQFKTIIRCLLIAVLTIYVIQSSADQAHALNQSNQASAQETTAGSIGDGPRFLNPTKAALLTDELLLVADAGENQLIEVTLATGDRRVFSSSEVGAGPDFDNIGDLLISTSGQILVSDLGRNALFSVDPATGNRTVLTGANVGDGPNLSYPRVITQESDSSILIVNTSNVYRVDLSTGNREHVRFLSSDEVDISAVVSATYIPDNKLVLADVNYNQLILVDLVSGKMTILANQVTGSGPSIQGPVEVVRLKDGSVAVGATSGSGRIPPSRIIKVDLLTRERSYMTANDVAAGPWLKRVSAFAESSNGDLITLDSGTRAVFKIDRRTGNRTILSYRDTFYGVYDIEKADDQSIYVLETATPPSDNEYRVPRLLKFDATTGEILSQLVVSGVDDMDISDVVSITTAESGISYLVAFAFIQGQGREMVVLRYDPSSNELATLSGFADEDQPEIMFPGNIEILSDQRLVVGSDNMLISVDIATGSREALMNGTSGFDTDVNYIADLTVESKDVVYLLDTKQRSAPNAFSVRAVGAEIIRIDLAAKTSNILSGPSTGSGVDFDNPQDIDMGNEGTLLVSDNRVASNSSGMVFEVDLATGDRNVLSNDIVGDGPAFQNILGIVYLGDGRSAVFDRSYLNLMFVDHASGSRSFAID